MKKVIRLTESDLIRLVKRVINEHPSEWDNDSEFTRDDSEGNNQNQQVERDYESLQESIYDECGFNVDGHSFYEFEKTTLYEPNMTEGDYIEAMCKYMTNKSNRRGYKDFYES